jgi:ketosteroid isomerase-like protein
MSQENVEIVRRATDMAEEGLRRGDPGAAFDECVAEGLIASNTEWRAGPRAGIGVAGLEDFVGREGYVQFVQTVSEDFDNQETEYERFIDAGDDRVLVVTNTSATGRGSRAPVEMRMAWLFELEAGCVVRVVLFLDPKDAFKAAGLSE